MTVEEFKKVFKYECFLSIFSRKPHTLSSVKVISASTLSRFLSYSNFDTMPFISNMLKEILSTIHHHTAFLIADISLLRKSGKNFDYIKVLYDPSSNTFVPAHRMLIPKVLHELSLFVCINCKLLNFVKSLIDRAFVKVLT